MEIIKIQVLIQISYILPSNLHVKNAAYRNQTKHYLVNVKPKICFIEKDNEPLKI